MLTITPQNAIQIIKSKFNGPSSTEEIPLMKKGKSFTAVLDEKGLLVDNLYKQNLIPWEVFETVMLELSKKRTLLKGNAMNAKLGDKKLLFDSVEGIIASKIYGRKEGDSVFRRISPVSAILSWAGICDNKKGYLSLREDLR